MDRKIPTTIEEWNAVGADLLPGFMGLEFIKVEADEVIGTLQIEPHHNIWNGFLHSATIVALADTCCGYGTVAGLPEGASGFTTLELKSNHLATLREGSLRCRAWPLHRGRSTQVWDAEVASQDDEKALAHFRCTQLILWPRA